jgi:hypothetical protein
MAEREYQLNLKLLTENFNRGIIQAESRIRAFTNNAKRDFNALGRTTKTLVSGKWSMFGGVIAGAAIYETIKKVGEFDDKVRRLAIDSGMTTAEMLAMKQQILETGMRTGVATDDLTSMSSAAYKTSKNIGFVKDELGFMAKIAQASGASGDVVGAALGEMQRESGLTGKAFEDMVTKLGAFGATKGARMSLAQFLPHAGSLLQYAKLLAKTGAIKDIGRVMIEGEFTGAPAAVEKAYRTMYGKGKNLKLMHMLGLKQGATLVDAVQAVFKKIKPEKQQAAFAMLFGAKSYAGLEPIITSVKELAEAEKEAAGIDFLGRANEQSKSFSASMNRLSAAFMTIADTSLAPIMDELSKSIAKIDPEAIKAFAQVLGTLAIAAVKTAEAIGTLVGSFTSYFALEDEKKAREAAAKTAEIGGRGSVIARATALKRMGKTQAAARVFEVASKTEAGEGHLASAAQLHKLSVATAAMPETHVVVNNYIDGKKIPSEKTVTHTKRGPQGKVTQPK